MREKNGKTWNVKNLQRQFSRAIFTSACFWSCVLSQEASSMAVLIFVKFADKFNCWMANSKGAEDLEGFCFHRKYECSAMICFLANLKVKRLRLTRYLKPSACSYQQEVEKTSQMLTYKLFKTKSMLLSAISRKGQPDPDLHPVQNPEHALVSNKQEGLARCWLTYCLNIAFHPKARQSK